MDVKKLVRMAVLVAISVVLVYLVRFPIIPAASFLEYDPADISILIGTFMYGPMAGLLITIVASSIQALTVSSHSGFIGFVMHVIATGTLVIVAGVIYKYKRTFAGAVIALIAGSISMALIMIPANLIFTVIFLEVPFKVVVDMIIPIILPFNLIKAFANSVVTILVYKHFARFLRDGFNLDKTSQA